MKTDVLRLLYVLFAVLFGIAWVTGNGYGQQFRFASDWLGQSGASVGESTPVRLIDYTASADSEGDYACDDGCSRAGWVGSSELLFLKPFRNENNTFDFNYRTGYRGSIGLQRYDGLGFRVRFFDYFQRAPGDERVDINYLDGELYDSLVDNETWFISVGGGIRYLDFFLGGSPVPSTGASLTGVGPVLTAELQRHLTDRWSLYAITRGSIIVGNKNEFGTIEPDSTGAMYEIQVGGQWSRPWRGALLFGRVGWEAHNYTNIEDVDIEQLTLMGAVLAGGIQR